MRFFCLDIFSDHSAPRQTNHSHIQSKKFETILKDQFINDMLF
ncbi:MAG: hypothetical protein JWQ57_407 [Mucilaginibacter sp.]|nr:hypothetical protein [Mucilaginibacter sp.]